MMLSWIKRGFALLLGLLLALFVLAAICARVYSTWYFVKPLAWFEQVLFYLPSVFFYALLLGLLSRCTAKFTQILQLKGLLISVFLCAVCIVESFFGAALKGTGDSATLFSFFYLLTQFHLWSHSFIIFVVVFLSIFLLLPALLWLSTKPSRKTVVLSALIIIGCLTPLLPSMPKSVHLAPTVYLIRSLTDYPRAQDFANEAPPIAPIQLPDVEHKPNIVIVVLESTRKDSLSIYNQALPRKTPFLAQLAQESMVFTQAYNVVPFTIKALTAIQCAISPYLNEPILESTMGIPKKCLAAELAQQGYQTLFMQSSILGYGNMRSLAKHLGFQQVLGADDFDKTGFQYSHPFGFQDEIMLQPNQAWLSNVKSPFFVTYLTLNPHWPYHLYDKKQAFNYLAENNNSFPYDFAALFNGYLNAVYQQDLFLEKLIQQYKQAGLYENTIFVFIADHGENFGEHRHYQHSNNLYQESVNIPLIIHAPKWLKEKGINTQLLSQLDVVTLLTNIMQQKPLLQGIQHQALFSSCWFWQWCVARVDQQYKYIHNFNDAPDELYDLTVDAMEKHNLAERYPERVKQFKQQTLQWYQQQLGIYGAFYQQQPYFYLLGHPKE